MSGEASTRRSFFFAYASQPGLRAETVRAAAAASAERGVEASTWEDLRVDGRLIIDPILERIDGVDACVAEISSSNPNVLFEAGYALGQGKELFLAIDETDNEATKAWSGLAFVDTVGRINYGGNAQILAARVSELAASPTPPLIESLLAGARPRELNAVFAPGVPYKFNAADRLERLLERKTHLKLLASQDDLGLGSLSYYVEEIYRSSAAVLHFMKPSRIRAVEYNSRLAFLAGIVRGLELPLLMVAEDGYSPPLDYKDLLFVYGSAAKLTDTVSAWLDSLPSPKRTNKRLGRLMLDIELPIRTFGQYVAEAEKESLTNYFVQTNEFEAVLAGRATVFTGRKGTGKTATMQQAVEELRKDRRVLVVPIKPSSYDLAGLLAVLERFGDVSKRDYFLISLWSYLLITEVTIRAISHAESRPAGLGADSNTTALVTVAKDMGVDLDSDLTTRLDEAITSAVNAGDHDSDLTSVSSALRDRWHGRLFIALRRVLHEYDRVAVLVDNLDKTWERGVDFQRLSQFLLSLLVTSGRLQSEFGKIKGGQPEVNLTLTIFLRTDIYDVMTTYAREPDKINPQAIQWRDEELLVRVLEERFEANRKIEHRYLSLWDEVFAPEVHSMATRDYFLWRALPRPRDVIFLGNAALTTAINRRHRAVLAQDLFYAEGAYSRFAVEALLVESEAQGFDLEEVLFEFAGLDSTVSEDQLGEVLASVEDPDPVKSWLIRTSFLGIETRDGSFIHAEGESEARKKLRAAQRLAERLNRPLQYRVHPAFRPYLDVRDDDVHSPMDEDLPEGGV